MGGRQGPPRRPTRERRTPMMLRSRPSKSSTPPSSRRRPLLLTSVDPSSEVVSRRVARNKSNADVGGAFIFLLGPCDSPPRPVCFVMWAGFDYSTTRGPRGSEVEQLAGLGRRRWKKRSQSRAHRVGDDGSNFFKL